MTGVDYIELERAEHFTKHGWTPEHDDQHRDGELVDAAIAYCMSADGNGAERGAIMFWPTGWDTKYFNETPTDSIATLARAGAMIAAEIDRQLRLQKTTT